jgi:hypothetical protein
LLLWHSAAHFLSLVSTDKNGHQIEGFGVRKPRIASLFSQGLSTRENIN